MAAGSGGIRWNSETNYIQLVDENKNWVNWQYYNPNFTVNHVFKAVMINTQSDTISLNKQGIYGVSWVSSDSNNHSDNLVVNNGQTKYSCTPMENYYINIAIVYSNGNTTLTIKGNGYTGSYGPSKSVIYYGPYSGVSSPSTVSSCNTTAPLTRSFSSNTPQLVMFVLCGAARFTRNFITSNIESSNISIWDPGNQNIYSAGCLNIGGSVSITGTAGVINNNGGGAMIVTANLT